MDNNCTLTFHDCQSIVNAKGYPIGHIESRQNTLYYVHGALELTRNEVADILIRIDELEDAAGKEGR